MLKGRVEHVMAPVPAGVRVLHELARREEPEPFPGNAGARVLALQRFGQPNPGHSLRPVLVVQSPQPVPMR